MPADQLSLIYSCPAPAGSALRNRVAQWPTLQNHARRLASMSGITQQYAGRVDEGFGKRRMTVNRRSQLRERAF